MILGINWQDFSFLSVHLETMFLDVILRSPANSGTTKNLEILRSAQDDTAELSLRSLS